MLYLFPIAAGLASAVQAALTSSLMKGLHNPFLVGYATLFGSIVIVGCIAAGFGGFGLGRAEVALVPWWAWLAGACGAVVLLSQPIAAHALGAGAYLGIVVTTAVVTSVLLDHFGWLGFDVHPAGIWRALGAVLMVAGVGLVALF